MPKNIYRYQLPNKAIKTDCPDCGPKHRKTLSRYVDTRTNLLLPELYGRCDRESNCGYHLSPYNKGVSGTAYADRVYEQWKNEQSQHQIPRSKVNSAYQFNSLPLRTQAPTPLICTIPDEVFKQSLGHYDQNQFAQLLYGHFGLSVANRLLRQFQIGTSAHWTGACVFWYIDEQNRKRGGQIKLFDEQFHTVRYVDRDGEKRTNTSWVHSAYKRRCDKQKLPYPAWLTDYLDEKNEVQKSPCLFGLPQLLTTRRDTTPMDQPVAIVEAPKTAVLCTPYFPKFVWLAVGSLSYLNAGRLATLRGRKVMLFPDLSRDGSAYAQWDQIASGLRLEGFDLTVSDYLEKQATSEQKLAGLDLADFLIDQWKGYPCEWDSDV